MLSYRDRLKAAQTSSNSQELPAVLSEIKDKAKEQGLSVEDFLEADQWKTDNVDAGERAEYFAGIEAAPHATPDSWRQYAEPSVLDSAWGDQYRGTLGYDVNRDAEYAQAAQLENLRRGMQAQGVGMMGDYAQGEGAIAPLLLAQRQNELQRQMQAAAAAGTPMAQRNAMLQGAGAGGQLAVQGIGNMAKERLAAQQAHLAGLGGLRHGDLSRSGLNIKREGDRDAWRNAWERAAMGYLGMGEQEKWGKVATEQGLMGSNVPAAAAKGSGGGFNWGEALGNAALSAGQAALLGAASSASAPTQAASPSSTDLKDPWA